MGARVEGSWSLHMVPMSAVCHSVWFHRGLVGVGVQGLDFLGLELRQSWGRDGIFSLTETLFLWSTDPRLHSKDYLMLTRTWLPGGLNGEGSGCARKEGGKWVRVLDEAILNQKERKEKRSYVKKKKKLWGYTSRSREKDCELKHDAWRESGKRHFEHRKLQVPIRYPRGNVSNRPMLFRPLISIRVLPGSC